MGRSIDQDVHAAFVEFRAKDEDKCLSVQCIYCHQIRAKNTSRQKEHLLSCPGLQNQPAGGVRPPSSSDASANGYGPAAPNPALNGNTSVISNGYQPANAPPPQPPRPSLPGPGTAPAVTPTQPSRATPLPKPRPTPKPTPNGSTIPAPPLDDVHAAFVEFRAKEEDKCLSVQCIYCNQIRAKNTSRQREHLTQCSTYLNVMKDSIPANNLLHRFDEGEVARSITLPTPTLELDFRMSIKLNPKVSLGVGPYGQRNWISFIGGQWAGRWGKGIIIPGGQDSQLTMRDLATRLDAKFLIQTNDEPPAMITCSMKGWWTGPKETMEKLHAVASMHPGAVVNGSEEDEVNSAFADTTPASSYKYRVNVELECGDDRYAFLNTCMWIGTGNRRSGEIVIDAYKVL